MKASLKASDFKHLVHRARLLIGHRVECSCGWQSWALRTTAAWAKVSDHLRGSR